MTANDPLNFKVDREKKTNEKSTTNVNDNQQVERLNA
jgi:hypothetical protein